MVTDVPDPPVAVRDEVPDGVRRGGFVVDADDVGVEARSGAVDQHQWRVGVQPGVVAANSMPQIRRESI